MNRILTPRPLIAGVLTLSLLGAGAAAATAAADPKPRDTARTAEPTDRQDKAAPARPSVTAVTVRKTVKQWEEFRITGRTTAVVPGSTVTLQQLQGERWVSLPAMTEVKHDGSYVLRAKLGMKGPNTLRMAAAGTMSKPFTVTVR